MSLKNIKPDQLKNLFQQNIPLMDVRAPVEFSQGSIPGAVNLPVMNDDERAQVGTVYKNQGNEAAVKLGHELVSGLVKEQRVAAWKSFVQAHPEAVFYCFRGGQRSRISQAWLKEAGVERPLLVGGFKAARNYLIKQIEEFSVRQELISVSGPTGSGKTHFLRGLKGCPVIDLEALARHRGSAFGNWEVPQPTQVDYENNLAREILLLEDKIHGKIKPLVEDESRLIGRISQPATFFIRLRSSPVIWIDEPLPVRVDNVFDDYILNSSIGKSLEAAPRCAEENDILRAQALQLFARYRQSLLAIQRKLGGLRAQEVMADLEKAELAYLNHAELSGNKVWIEKLLQYYYDPMYLGSLERRHVTVLFKGTRFEAEKFVHSLT
ncbi:tRNA 2-selenouridine(34) synthase MnmH [Bdellovibrio bacteriovorus]|uniref:tRNA 2-selenouridine synthase n=1 Tax=Bdellovibrio bacteriovorus (strain ATCC 15356 / DSM 50701 / NCIMB 9529 / HD100) TaxID=264462 RepID=SELU_BDEBA|nr:tRNA 2-selenouridine(34) synthase MnmH [Bdellovibrio bacteriovorus]Q6MK43.2 RecName: Full=tRNA 2-selenouridine synthase [Bdellovibrio bacteriovorus HD100]